MAGLTHISEKELQQRVQASKIPLLVEFGAAWCAPCKRLEPILIDLQGEYAGRLEVYQVDVDADPDLAIRFSVMGVPALILFIDGQPRERLNGLVPRARIVEKISPHLPAA